MRMNPRWMALLLLLPAAGCVGEAEDPDVQAAGAEVAPGAAQPNQQQATAREIDGALRPLGGSAVQGQWKMAPLGNDTRVDVLLTSNDRATYPGAIHNGSCEVIGEVVAPLQPVTTALGPESSEWTTSTVTIPIFNMVKGDHVMVFHTADGTPVACGHIPYEASPAAT